MAGDDHFGDGAHAHRIAPGHPQEVEFSVRLEAGAGDHYVDPFA
jgi:hypothetical protein